MKKVLLFLIVSLMVISLVLGIQGNVEVGQGTKNGNQTNTEFQAQNRGENTQLQNRVNVTLGTYMNQMGK